MDKKALETIKNILKLESNNINRLLGGMSNYTYVVETDNEMYTVRLLGEFAEKFVNREDEEKGIKIFEKLSLTNKTIYFNKEDGIKISKYIDGVPLNELEDRHYQEVCEIMKSYHNKDIDIDIDYDPFNRLLKYESYLKDYCFPDRYKDIKNKFFEYRDYLESLPKVFCHNDSQRSNFFLSNNDNKIYIVDFEFVGKNDYIYDIACYGNNDFNDAIELLKVYENNNVSDDKYLRLYLWKTFQSLQWYNVAMFKELNGLSETLKINFKDVAEFFLNMAEDCLKSVLLFDHK